MHVDQIPTVLMTRPTSTTRNSMVLTANVPMTPMEVPQTANLIAHMTVTAKLMNFVIIVEVKSVLRDVGHSAVILANIVTLQLEHAQMDVKWT